jgi:60 kDa SS-A/Ro ribonucleoprotein
VCIDLTPNTTTQALNRKDILNIGGFSDTVFDLLASFASGTDGTDHWIREIQLQPLRQQSSGWGILPQTVQGASCSV